MIGRIFRGIFLCFALFLSFSSMIMAAAPQKIHYQGRLTTPSDGPISPGEYTITVRIYDSETGGTKLWEETHTVTLDKKGYFYIELGDKMPLTLDFTQPYWMSIEVNSDGEMSPRIPLLSVGYSYNTETIDGVDSQQFLRSDVDDTMEANLTIEGTTTMQSSLVISGVEDDITAPSGEDIKIKPEDNGNVIIELSSGNFKINNGSSDLFSLDKDGNITITPTDNSKTVTINPGNLIIGNGTPSTAGMNGGDLFVAGDLEVGGSLTYGSVSAGDSALVIDVDDDEALLVRKNADAGDVFVVDTNAANVEVRSGVSGSTNALIMSHNNTDAEISTSTGRLILEPASGNLTQVGPGSTTASHLSSPSNQDLFVVGNMEVDGQTYIDNNLSVQGQTTLSNSTGDTLVITQGGSNDALVVQNGLTRIGSGTPSYADGANDLFVGADLEVGGNGYISGNLTVSGSIFGDVNPGLTAGSVVFVGNSGELTEDNANFFWDASSYRLGIGTSSPSATLDIFGSSNELRLSYDASTYVSLMSSSTGKLSISSSSSTQSSIKIGDGTSKDAVVFFDGDSQDYYVGEDDSDNALKIGSGSSVGTNAYITVLSSGNVGIGTTSPSTTLEVNGSGLISTDFTVNGNTTLGDASSDSVTINASTMSVPNNLNVDSDTLYIDAANNRIGIGTTSPGGKLDVRGGSTSGDYTAVFYCGTELAAWIKKK